MVAKSFVPCWKSSEHEGGRAVGSQEDGMAGERRALSIPFDSPMFHLVGHRERELLTCVLGRGGT